jgi:hypothetical protein
MTTRSVPDISTLSKPGCFFGYCCPLENLNPRLRLIELVDWRRWESCAQSRIVFRTTSFQEVDLQVQTRIKVHPQEIKSCKQRLEWVESKKTRNVMGEGKTVSFWVGERLYRSFGWRRAVEFVFQNNNNDVCHTIMFWQIKYLYSS